MANGGVRTSQRPVNTFGNDLLPSLRNPERSARTSLRALTDPIDDRTGFGRGFDSGAFVVRGEARNLRAAVTSALGGDPTEDLETGKKFTDLAARFGPRVRSIQDIKSPEDAVEFVTGLFGEQGAIMGTSIATGVATGLATGGPGGALVGAGAGLARGLGSRQATRLALRQAKKKLKSLRDEAPEKRQAALTDIQGALEETRPFINPRGIAAGTFGAAGGIEAGANFGEIAEAEGATAENARVALVFGAFQGMLEALPQVKLLKRLGISGDPAGDIAKHAQRRFGSQALEQAIMEGGTEVGQEFLSLAAHKYVNDNIELFSPEALDRYLDSFVGGFLVGGGLGGAAGLVSKASARLTDRIEKHISGEKSFREQVEEDAKGAAPPPSGKTTSVEKGATKVEKTAAKKPSVEKPITTKQTDQVKKTESGFRKLTSKQKEQTQGLEKPVKDLTTKQAEQVRKGTEPVRSTKPKSQSVDPGTPVNKEARGLSISEVIKRVKDEGLFAVPTRSIEKLFERYQKETDTIEKTKLATEILLEYDDILTRQKDPLVSEQVRDTIRERFDEGVAIENIASAFNMTSSEVVASLSVKQRLREVGHREAVKSIQQSIREAFDKGKDSSGRTLRQLVRRFDLQEGDIAESLTSEQKKKLAKGNVAVAFIDAIEELKAKEGSVQTELQEEEIASNEVLFEQDTLRETAPVLKANGRLRITKKRGEGFETHHAEEAVRDWNDKNKLRLGQRRLLRPVVDYIKQILQKDPSARTEQELELVGDVTRLTPKLKEAIAKKLGKPNIDDYEILMQERITDADPVENILTPSDIEHILPKRGDASPGTPHANIAAGSFSFNVIRLVKRMKRRIFERDNKAFLVEYDISKPGKSAARNMSDIEQAAFIFSEAISELINQGHLDRFPWHMPDDQVIGFNSKGGEIFWRDIKQGTQLERLRAHSESTQNFLWTRFEQLLLVAKLNKNAVAQRKLVAQLGISLDKIKVENGVVTNAYDFVGKYYEHFLGRFHMQRFKDSLTKAAKAFRSKDLQRKQRAEEWAAQYGIDLNKAILSKGVLQNLEAFLEALKKYVGIPAINRNIELLFSKRRTDMEIEALVKLEKNEAERKAAVKKVEQAVISIEEGNKEGFKVISEVLNIPQGTEGLLSQAYRFLNNNIDWLDRSEHYIDRKADKSNIDFESGEPSEAGAIKKAPGTYVMQNRLEDLNEKINRYEQLKQALLDISKPTIAKIRKVWDAAREDSKNLSDKLIRQKYNEVVKLSDEILLRVKATRLEQELISLYNKRNKDIGDTWSELKEQATVAREKKLIERREALTKANELHNYRTEEIAAVHSLYFGEKTFTTFDARLLQVDQATKPSFEDYKSHVQLAYTRQANIKRMHPNIKNIDDAIELIESYLGDLREQVFLAYRDLSGNPRNIAENRNTRTSTDAYTRAIDENVYKEAKEAAVEKIESINNDTLYSRGGFVSQQADIEQLAQMRAYIENVVGDIRVEDFLYDPRRSSYAGKYDAETHIIEVASNFVAPWGISLAAHESMHAVYRTLLNQAEKRILVKFFTNDLIARRVLSFYREAGIDKGMLDNIAAQMDPDTNPYWLDERIAYGFQAWFMSRRDDAPAQFNINGEPKSIFQKLLAMLKHLFGFLTPDEKVQALFDHINNGNVRAARELGKRVPLRYGTGLRPPEQLINFTNAIFRSAGGFLDRYVLPADIALRRTGNPAFIKLANLAYKSSLYADENNSKETMLEQYKKANVQFLNLFQRSWDELSPQRRKALFDNVYAHKTPDQVPEGTQRDDLKMFRHFMDVMYEHVKRRDASLGQVSGVYVPLVFDQGKLEMNKQQFIDMLNAQVDAVTLQQHGGAEVIFESLVREHDIFAVPASIKTKEKFAKPRNYPFFAKLDMRPYVAEDLEETMHRYVTQITRHAEFEHFFGVDGTKAEKLLEEAAIHGATPQQIAAAHDYVLALKGSLGSDINKKLLSTFSWITTYQNYRTLGLALLTSLVEILGIAVRTGSIRTTWKALRESSKQVSNLYVNRDEIRALRKREKELATLVTLNPAQEQEWARIQKRKREMKTELNRLAQRIGTLDGAGIMSDALTEMFSTTDMELTPKKLNRFFFRYINGLEMWTNFTRVTATHAAKIFIEENALHPKKHSVRFLKELDIDDPSELAFDPEGNILLDIAQVKVHFPNMPELDAINKAKKGRDAVWRFVDQSVLRPNPAQRPIAASDPHFMLLYHLKQFIFSFQVQIINRVFKELKHKNVVPLAYLMSFIPGMLAADMLRWMIQYPLDGPDWDDDWEWYDYAWRSTQRSGVLGMIEPIIQAHNNTTKFGGSGIEALIGPAPQQGVEIARTLLTGNPSTYRQTCNALPLNNVYRAWFNC